MGFPILWQLLPFCISCRFPRFCHGLLRSTDKNCGIVFSFFLPKKGTTAKWDKICHTFCMFAQDYALVIFRTLPFSYLFFYQQQVQSSEGLLDGVLSIFARISLKNLRDEIGAKNMRKILGCFMSHSIFSAEMSGKFCETTVAKRTDTFRSRDIRASIECERTVKRRWEF